MLRMVQAAAAAMVATLLAALFFARPAVPQPDAPKPSNLLPSVEPPPGPVQRQLAPEISSILQARRQLGSVVEGTSLDDRNEGGDFVAALEQLLPP